MKLKTRFKEIKIKIKNLDGEENDVAIKQTADRLYSIQYQPPFVIEVKGFVKFTKKDALNALENLYHASEESITSTGIGKDHSVENVKIIAMEMLFKEFTLLQRLRKDVAEAWDQINELYEDD